MSEEYVGKAIRQALSREESTTAGACPGPDLVGAYLEARLPEKEKEALEQHVAVCAACREVLALSLSIQEESEVQAAPAVTSGRKVIFRFSIPVTALAMIFVAVISGVLYLRSPKTRGTDSPVAQTAQLRAPEQRLPALPANPPDQDRVVERSEAQTPAERSVAGRLKDARNEAPASAVEPAAPASKPEPPSAPSTARIPEPRSGESDARSLAAVPVTPSAAIADQPAEKAEMMRAAAAPHEVMEMRPTPDTPASQAGSKSPTGESRFSGSGGVGGGLVNLRPAGSSYALSRNAAMKEKARSTREAIQESIRLGFSADEANRKSVGDKVFRFAAGFWVDEQSSLHPDAVIEELKAGSGAYEGIVKHYPDLAKILPAVLFQSGKNLVLR